MIEEYYPWSMIIGATVLGLVIGYALYRYIKKKVIEMAENLRQHQEKIL